MMQSTIKRTEPHWLRAATAALEVLRADARGRLTCRRSWSGGASRALCRTWAALIDRSFTIHDDPLVACCQAGRTIVADYYSRPPLAHESVSDLVKNSLSDIIGGSLFATLQKDQASPTPPKPAPPLLSLWWRLNTSVRRQTIC